jgi:hypothetical protein
MIIQDPFGVPNMTTFVDDTPPAGQLPSVKPLHCIKSLARAFELNVDVLPE